jgi:hypothetical protein
LGRVTFGRYLQTFRRNLLILVTGLKNADELGRRLLRNIDSYPIYYYYYYYYFYYY